MVVEDLTGSGEYRQWLGDIELVMEVTAISRARKDTGEMISKIHGEIEGAAANQAVILYSDAEHSADNEYGTLPHVIEAKPGGVLHFKGSGGEDVFVKRVNHPGTQAQPFMRPALTAAQRFIGNG